MYACTECRKESSEPGLCKFCGAKLEGVCDACNRKVSKCTCEIEAPEKQEHPIKEEDPDRNP